jgi:hypothetical protein
MRKEPKKKTKITFGSLCFFPFQIDPRGMSFGTPKAVTLLGWDMKAKTLRKGILRMNS